MVSFANSDYDFLIKCLNEGSPSYKAESIKRLTVLVSSDKKQFASNVRKVLFGLEELLLEDKQEINLLATLLLLEILPNMVSKEVDHILKSKILRIVVRNLGDVNRPSLRKSSHSCLLQYVKSYHNFDSLLYHYTKEGLTNGTSWQLQQKCINSFQSILIMEVRHLNWTSFELRRWFQLLLDRLKDENLFVGKAASQCLSSFCKMQSVKMLIENLSLDSLGQLKGFVKTEQDLPDLSEQYIQDIIRNKIEQLKKKERPPPPVRAAITLEEELKAEEREIKPTKPERPKEPVPVVEKEPQPESPLLLAHKEVRSHSTNPVVQDFKRIDRIRRNLRTQKKPELEATSEPIPESMNNIFNKKLMDNLRNENNWKQRIEAAQEILCKIEINKHKPELEGVIRTMLPTIIKLLSDQNFKLVLVGLKILQNILESSHFRHDQSDALIPALTDKLSDAKISVRQNVFKLIKILMRTTEPDVWVDYAIGVLVKGANQFQKDELFNLLQYVYEEYGGSISYSWENILRSVAPFMEDPKTKVKIKALDTLVLVAVKNSKVEEATDILRELLSPVFFEMFVEKISKSVRNTERRIKINRIHAAVSETYSVGTPTLELERTIQLDSRAAERNRDTPDQGRYERRFDLTKANLKPKEYETLDMKELKLNSSIEVARKGLLNIHKKNRKFSMKERDSNKVVSVIATRKQPPKQPEDVELVLPSLNKKTIPHTIPDLPLKVDAKFNLTGSKSSRPTYEPVKPKSQIDHNKGSQYLERSQLQFLQDPEKQFRTIANSFKDPDWHNQFEAINTMRRIVENHQEVVATSGSSSIHLLVVELLKMVESLRSSVSKNAMIALGQMITKLRRSLDSEIEPITEKLLKKAADTNIFINEEVKKCLTLLAVNVSENKLLQVMSLYKDSKTFSVKESLISMLSSMIDSDRVLRKQHARIGEMLVFFLNQGHLELRTKARAAIMQLCHNLPDWQKQLKAGLSSEAFKAVLELYSKNEASMSTSHLSINGDEPKSSPHLRTMDQRIEPKLPPSTKKEGEPLAADWTTKRRIPKITSFPQEFGRVDELYEECKVGEWKKRIQCIRDIADMALRFPNEFCQYRSSSKFMDLMAQHIIDPNIKVSLHAMQLMQELMEPLKPLFESNLSIITNSVFNSLSSNKSELREEAERACSAMFASIDIGLLLQHLCHGCLYSLPKSKTNLLSKLIRLLEAIYQNRQPLIGKHIVPMLNKLVDENKAEYTPMVVEISRKLLAYLGEEFYVAVAKPNVIRDLLIG